MSSMIRNRSSASLAALMGEMRISDAPSSITPVIRRPKERSLMSFFLWTCAHHLGQLHALARHALAHRPLLLADEISILVVFLARVLHAVVLERMTARLLLPAALDDHRLGVVLRIRDRHLDVVTAKGSGNEAFDRLQL